MKTSLTQSCLFTHATFTSMHFKFLTTHSNIYEVDILPKYKIREKMDQNPRWPSWWWSSIICLSMLLTFWYHLAFATISIKSWIVLDWSTVFVASVVVPLDPVIPVVTLVPMVSLVSMVLLVLGLRSKAASALPKMAKTIRRVSRLVFILTKPKLT